MAKLRLALIVSARRELRLSAGETPLGSESLTGFELLDQRIETLDGPAYQRTGLAQVGSIFLSGAEVVNPAYPEDSLSLSWYLPDEEAPAAARPVPFKGVGLIPAELRREPAEPGGVWRFRVEGCGPFVETLFFDSGFHPPFKASDLTLHLTDLSGYGYASTILTQVLYGHRAPTYSEGEWGFAEVIAEGALDD
ncbi:MAG: hypothetical protein LBU12_04975 [Deltaproteobacteria bacterium]|jgi:hypothetical protein|nr:hypothetical protein [Deltaproteobacteria bacterium]